MMTKQADLHIHTHFSDSTSSPQEVVEQAYQNEIQCIAITDHDLIDGIAPTKEAAKKYGIEVIPGVEISSQIRGKDVHILGYLFDENNVEFKEQLKLIQNHRTVRMKQMIAKLHDLGMKNIDFEEVYDAAQSKALGRPHLAAQLVAKGWVKNIRQAFNKYLADGGPAYVNKCHISPEEAIDMINKARGIAVLAHPYFTKVDEFIPRFVRCGMGGLEVYYPNTIAAHRKFYEGLVKKHGIVATGGSDAHGEAKKHTYIGKIKIPYENVLRLKEAHEKHVLQL